jgi:hypothetical protein
MGNLHDDTEGAAVCDVAEQKLAKLHRRHGDCYNADHYRCKFV